MAEAYTVMAASCPSRVILHRIGARWTIFVITALADREMRFTELKAYIQGITPKVLTETLRSLEHDGLIERTDRGGIRSARELFTDPTGPLAARSAGRGAHLGREPRTRCAGGQCPPGDAGDERTPAAGHFATGAHSFAPISSCW